MKRYFLLASIAGLVFATGNIHSVNAAPASHQVAQSQAEFPEVRAKRLVSKLNLAVRLQGDEWSKANKTYVDYYTQLDVLDKQKSSLSAADYNTKLAALKSSRDEKIKAILTAEQSAKWAEFQTRHGEQ